MRILVASDSFKGSLSSSEIARIVDEVAARSSSTVETLALPMADGGEGTVEALVSATGGVFRHTCVTGPLGDPVDAVWGLLPDGAAAIEMAAASGLPLVPEGLRDPLHTTTRGTGELVSAALDAGATVVLLTIGGSATNDGGMGALSALGVSFLDAGGGRLPGVGADLARVARVDLAALDLRLADGGVSVCVMCDVDNPLLGPDGAAATFAPQKGADEMTVVELEAGMASYARCVCSSLGIDYRVAVGRAGAGAAGGLGFALATFLGAEMLPGVDVVLGRTGFDDLLKDVDLVITGEGRLDAQTAHGKVVSGVARRCRQAGVPCVAIVGSLADGTDARALGLTDAVATAPDGMPLAEAMARARELYADAAREVLLSFGG